MEKDIDNILGMFEMGCYSQKEAKEKLLNLHSVSDSVDTGIDFSYKDENGEIQHNNVSTETAQALLRRWQEQEIKVNKFIKDYHKTN